MEKPRKQLATKYLAIISYIGLISAWIGLLMLVPLLVLPSWPEETDHSYAFLIPSIVLMGVGYSFYRFYGPKSSNLTIQDSSVLVLFCWIIASIIGAIPIYLIEKVTLTQAIFESVSGWTTTGLSILNVEQTSHLILLWRSIMQLVGGAGLIVIMLATIAGPIGMGLSRAEGREELLVPHVKQTMKIVLCLYSAYAAIGAIAYMIVGMDGFDAVNHAFCAVSTGGFSTKGASIGHWDSLLVEAVTMVLMTLGATNFLVIYLVLQKRPFVLLRSGEVRLATFMALIGIPALFLLTTSSLYPQMPKAVRVAVFEFFSAITTTGFSSVSYNEWSPFGIFFLIILMLVGGGAYSTAGGIKQFRISLLVYAIYWQIQRNLKPASAVVEHYIWRGSEKEYVSDKRILNTAMYFVFYMFSLVLGTAVITAHGYPIRESFFEFASSQGTVGLSSGITGSATPPLVLWVQILGMFLGRLEFFIVFLALMKIVKGIPRFFKLAFRL